MQISGRQWFLHMTGIRRAFLGYVLTTGNGWQSSSSSWDKTFFLTVPWNWISPQKLRNTWQRCQLQAGVSFCIGVAWSYLSDGNLHRDAGGQLGNVLGLPELFAEIQKIHTELMTSKRQREIFNPTHIYLFILQKRHQITYFSCVVKISKQLLLSNWLSIFSKGTETLKKDKKQKYILRQNERMHKGNAQ